MAKDVGTIKWLPETGWNGWLNDQHFQSMGIGQITSMMENAMPFKNIEWEASNGKLICRESTAQGKLSKKDQ